MSEPSPWARTTEIAKQGIGVAWICFQIGLLLFPQPPLVQCPIHLGFAVWLVLLWHPLQRNGPGGDRASSRVVPGTTEPDGANRSRRSEALKQDSEHGESWKGGFDLILLLAVGAAMVYYLCSADRLTGRMEGVDEVLGLDKTVGLILIIAVLECVRRVIGWSLLGVILGFLAFGFAGRVIPGWVSAPWIPEMLKFSGFTLEEAVESFTMTANGLLGVTTSTSVMFVFYFVVFGAVYSAIGGGQFFIDLGLRIAGAQHGGAAKAAIVSSALMGTVSGSAVANVSAVGVFTIPLMKRAGYAPVEAAAVEAIASTGGQLMPPVMGVAAFVMAELLQMPYAKIALAGVIPAAAFYLALFLAVDVIARKKNLGMVNPDEIKADPVWPRLYLLAPPLLLIALLATGKSASSAAAWAAAACVPTSFLSKASRRNSRAWMGAILQATRQAAEVAVPIAAIGLIIEVAVQSNLALKFAIGLAELGADNAILSLMLVIIACIVMGMGLPTVAAYLIGAILFVPVLIDLGIPQLPAHFFVMYYCVLSMVTPPVALASFTAAGLAQADIMATSWKAFRLSLAAFFIPFVFVFEPALLAQGTVSGVVLGLLWISAGTIGWIVALEGYFFRPLPVGLRSLVGVASVGVCLAPLIADRWHTSGRLSLATARGWVTVVTLGMLAAALACCPKRQKRK